MPLGGTGGVQGELELISALTVNDILSPLDRVDYLEIDIQSSEAVALPPAREVCAKKVRWLHLGTHGVVLHRAMARMFLSWGWEILADILPEARYETPAGPFTTQDGVLVARNPRVQWSPVGKHFRPRAGRTWARREEKLRRIVKQGTDESRTYRPCL